MVAVLATAAAILFRCTTSLTRFQVCRLPDSCSPLLDHSLESWRSQEKEDLLCYSTRKSEHLYVSITSPICAVFSLVLAAPDSEECRRRRVWGAGEQNVWGQVRSSEMPPVVPVYGHANMYRLYTPTGRCGLGPTGSGGRRIGGTEETFFTGEAWVPPHVCNPVSMLCVRRWYGLIYVICCTLRNRWPVTVAQSCLSYLRLYSSISLSANFTYSRRDSVNKSVRKPTEMIVENEGIEASALKPQQVFFSLSLQKFQKLVVLFTRILCKILIDIYSRCIHLTRWTRWSKGTSCERWDASTLRKTSRAAAGTTALPAGSTRPRGRGTSTSICCSSFQMRGWPIRKCGLQSATIFSATTASWRRPGSRIEDRGSRNRSTLAMRRGNFFKDLRETFFYIVSSSFRQFVDLQRSEWKFVDDEEDGIMTQVRRLL